MGATIRRRWYIVVPIVLIFGALFATDGWLMAKGCGSVDPTDPGNYSSVLVRNDTAGAVVVSACRGDYCSLPDRAVHLAPGAAVKVNAACAASGKSMTSWRVSDQDGAQLGFIAVDTPRKSDGLVYAVSSATASRAIAAQPERAGSANRSP